MYQTELEKSKRNLSYSNYFLAMLLFIVFIFMIYQIYPIEIYEQKDGVMKLITPVVIAGERVEYVSEFCKYYDTEAIVSKQLVDSYLYYYTPTKSKFPSGCSTVVISEYIPEFIPPGEYFLRVQFEYRLPFFKTVVHHVETEKFMVVNPYYDALRETLTKQAMR